MIGALVTLLSLDMTRKLVAAGIVAKALTITDATDATPVVLTFSAPHKIITPVHAVVSGVGGNGGANGVWIMSVVDTTRVSLSSFTRAGTAYNSAGDGAYTSGGTASIAFPEGRIGLGSRELAMNLAMAPPRIVFVPSGSPEWGFEAYGGAQNSFQQPARLTDIAAEQQLMMLDRQIATERQRFEVHVTGRATPPDPSAGDFDMTQAIYQSLFGSFFDLITPSRGKFLSGEWASQEKDVAKLLVTGQRWVGMVEIHQPVTNNPLTFVPHSTDGTITVNLINASSTEETVIVIPTSS